MWCIFHIKNANEKSDKMRIDLTKDKFELEDSEFVLFSPLDFEGSEVSRTVPLLL